MKLRILIFIAAASSVSWAGEAPKEGTKSDVVVGRIAEALPAKGHDLNRWLSDQFGNKPLETQFRHNSITNWETNYKAFGSELVQRARTAGLQADILGKALDTIPSIGDPRAGFEEDQGTIAYLPVGAYSAILQGKPVWIVVVKWAAVGISETFGHIRIYVFDQDTGKVVGFSTCT